MDNTLFTDNGLPFDVDHSSYLEDGCPYYLEVIFKGLPRKVFAFTSMEEAVEAYLKIPSPKSTYSSKLFMEIRNGEKLWELDCDEYIEEKETGEKFDYL